MISNHIRKETKHRYYNKNVLHFSCKKINSVKLFSNSEKNTTFFEAENWPHMQSWEYLKILTYGLLSESQYITEYKYTLQEGENHHSQRNENITCRDLAYIPNTQPIPLSSKGKDKREVRAASCTEQNSLAGWEKENFFSNLKMNLSSENSSTKKVLTDAIKFLKLLL